MTSFASAALLVAATAFAAQAYAADDQDHTKLAGTWQVEQGSTEDAASTWTFQERADAIHITTAQGATKLADFECNTEGRDCAVSESGKKIKVSMWFAGPMLVELETRGSDVVKRRFGVSGQGDTLEMEVIPIVPQGKTEQVTLKRVSSAGAATASAAK